MPESALLIATAQIMAEGGIAAPRFDNQNEDGVRSTLFPLEQLGKDVYSQMKMLLCIYVCKYVSNGVRDSAMTNARI